MTTETAIKPNVPKWKSIYDSVKESNLSPGSQFYTLSELCSKYDVSQITARHVFKRLKEDGIIVTAGRRGAIIQGKRNKMALLCFVDGFFQTAHRNFFDYELIQKLSKGLEDGGAKMFSEVHHIPVSFLDSKPEVLDNDIIMHSTAFNVVSPEGDPLNYNLELLDRLRKLPVRPILVRVHNKACLEGFPRIAHDIRRGFYDMTSLAVDRGHTKFAFLGYNTCGQEMMMRFNGFTEALQDRSIPFSMNDLLTIPRENFGAAVEKELKKLMTSQGRPTVLICYNDQLALKVLEVAQKEGIKVPDDLAVTGCDDVNLCKLSSPSLTTINQNHYKTGLAIADMIKKRRSGLSIDDELVIVDFELKIRDSL